MVGQGFNLVSGLIGQLQDVDDPQDIYSDMTRRDYDNYIKDFRTFEEALLALRNDTSLIDQTREDTQTQRRIAREVSQRNLERYGGAGLSPAQQQQQAQTLQRESNLASVNAINNSRVAQREINQNMLANLIDIGQGVNRNALGQMQTAAGLQSQRYNAYKNARAQHSANMIGMGGQIGSALLAAFMI
jgi:hypothetical protein